MQTYQQPDAEIVATPAAIEAASQPAATDYQKIEAEFARYEAEAAALKQRMDALNKQREGLRAQERAIAIPEILARIAALGIKPEDLGFASKTSKSKAPSIHRYSDPATGKTHSGKGGLPGWLTKEAKKDPRYENPAWTAKQNQAKSPDTPATDETPASTDAPVASNGTDEQALEHARAEVDSNAPQVDQVRTNVATVAESAL